MEPQRLLGSTILGRQRQRQIEQIRDAIDSLSEKNREVVYEFYICGYTADQIGGRLGIPVSTVNSRLKEARKQLREEFATMVALSKIQETFAPDNFVQQVMERVASLPLPVPKGGLIDKIKSLLPAKTVTAIGIATVAIGTGIGVTFTPLRTLLPGAQAQLVETKIAFHSYRGGNAEIYVMNADGTNPINLTQHPALDVGAYWSPDGTKIAFGSDRDGNRELYVMNADGSNPVRLTNHPALDAIPIWSPDGGKIAFASDRGGNLEIYVMNADGTNPINLTQHPALDNAAAWSPDGGKIAFGSDRDGNWKIYVMGADGKNPVNLTKHPANESWPSWSPAPKPTLVALKDRWATLWGRLKRGR
jgi:hypothetical protein